MRGNGEGSIRKRPDGRWEARYYTGRDPKTGKNKRKSVFGKTRKEVAEKLRDRLSQLNMALILTPVNLPLMTGSTLGYGKLSNYKLSHQLSVHMWIPIMHL